jgi:hypothetical protein
VTTSTGDTGTRSLEDAPRRLGEHARVMAELVAEAERLLDAGRPERAAVLGQTAGWFAWMNHSGAFADPRLERLLARAGATLPGVPASRPRTTDPAVVLHVATQVYPTGGSTQAIACWVDQDADRRHLVAVSRQGTGALPEKLTGRVGPADLHRLDRVPGGLLRRAAALRRLAATADVVLLHTHPYDVVPLLAFADRAVNAPVILVNHTDHVFWLGVGVSDVVMHMRDSGRDLATARRGVDPARSVVMNRPLRFTGRTIAREEAKARLGVQPDRLLLVTTADGSKYRPVSGPGFLDVMLPFLERRPDVDLVAAGPAAEGEWAAAAERTGGRVRALGLLPDVSVLQQAADVYVDSFPFASLTSLLETGSTGTPVLTYRGHPAECGVLGADTRGLDELMLAPADPVALGAELGRLIDDPALRKDLGDRTATAILESHSGRGWSDAVAGLYATAGGSEGRPAPGPAPRGDGPLDRFVELVMFRTGYAQGLPGAVRDSLPLLPAAERLATWSRLRRDGHGPGVKQALPEWVAARAAGWKRAVLR